LVSVLSILVSVLLAPVPLLGRAPEGGGTLTSALIKAAERGETAQVRRLLDHGVPVEARDAEDFTALQRASQRGNVPVMRLLITHHARVDARNPRRQTALIVAARAAQPGAIRVLLDAGADVNAREDNGATALVEAAGAGPAAPRRTAAVNELLMRGTDVNAHDAITRTTALLWAAMWNNADVLKLLLDHGAAVNVRSWMGGETPLMFAAENGSEKSVRRLLAHGADPHLRDNDGRTAYDWAVQGRHPAIARLLKQWTSRSRAGRWTARTTTSASCPSPTPLPGDGRRRPQRFDRSLHPPRHWEIRDEVAHGRQLPCWEWRS